MDIKPMLSMEVIKRYIDNIDGIKHGHNITEYDKQAMTEREVELYKKNLEIITAKYGKLGESTGGLRWSA